MQKKKKEATPTPDAKPIIDIKDDPTLTAGDVETYVFDFLIKQPGDYVYEIWKKEGKEVTKEGAAEVSAAELANEKAITELQTKYAKVPAAKQELAKKISTAPTKAEETTANTKSLEESLKRIIRYNNKRKYDERVGFASTIANNAEEIGKQCTIKYLLPAISDHLVIPY